MDSKALLEYGQSIRSRYLEKLASLPWDKIIESRRASFDSLRNILLHTVDAEDMMVNYVIADRRKDWMSRNPEEFHDMDSLRKRARDTKSRTKAYLSKLTPTELDRQVDFSKPGMPPMLVRVRGHCYSSST
ncbi:DinB family protein [Candidatus Bathyarchaeota archaeon]|nr:DinB family protein [Candidatus Bathyarchaeota archaeon]